MSMMDAVKKCFENYANFNGRARRSEYWYFYLFNMLISLGLYLLSSLAGEGFISSALGTISSLYGLAVLIPGLAVCWRRLHDIGKSGANWFFIFIPIVGAVLLIVWFATEGNHGDNAYGPDPKGQNNVY